MDFLKIGFIKKPHGIRGEIKVLPLTDDPSRFKKLKKVFLKVDEDYTSQEIESVKIGNSEILLKFKGFNKIEDVLFLKDLYVFVEKKEGVKLAEWEYYSQDLVGCNVYFKNRLIGVVVDFDNFGANDNLVISFDSKEYYYPFLRQYIDKVDVRDKVIEINQLEDFFD